VTTPNQFLSFPRFSPFCLSLIAVLSLPLHPRVNAAAPQHRDDKPYALIFGTVWGPEGQPLHLVQEVTVHIYNDEREDTGLHLAR
jgi:hypothetical protein